MTAPPPAKPIVALSVCFAGKRDVPEAARSGLEASLGGIFAELSDSLAELRAAAARPPLALRFSGDAPARLTLITGLADGADHIAADRFLALPDDPARIERVLGAVLPTAREAFVADSPVDDRATFERQASACAFILELDGSLHTGARKGGPEPRRSHPGRQRAQAFRGQAEVLLRNGDLLVAVDGGMPTGQLGGTSETVRSALDLGLPVILLQLGESSFAILRTRSDLDHPVRLERAAAAEALRGLVGELLGASIAASEDAYLGHLMEEFYSDGPQRRGLLGLETLLPPIWRAFEKALGQGASGGAPGAPPSAYAAYRRRASELSGYYAGLYKGSFLAGYGLAVAAVAFATLSLLTSLGVVSGVLTQSAGVGLLLGLGLLKLAAVLGMASLARHAHRRRLSHRAADYRYLSERLRTMTFLPLVGSLRPPPHLSQPYTTRVVSQGAMDRLFYSILRQAQPLGSTGPGPGREIRLEAHAAMAAVSRDWLAVQRRYHEGNAHAQTRIAEWLERWSSRINAAIVVIVVAEIGMVSLDLLHLLPKALADVLHHGGEPLLLAAAAILPAAVAAMNGVRFQSEVSRLADRSEQMSYELAALAERAEQLWSTSGRLRDVLHVAEDAARLTLDEVAEWTSIYGKEFVEM